MNYTLPTAYNDRPIRIQYLDCVIGIGKGRYDALWQAILSKRGDGIFWCVMGTHALGRAGLLGMHNALKLRRFRAGLKDEDLAYFMSEREGFTFLWKKRLEPQQAVSGCTGAQ